MSRTPGPWTADSDVVGWYGGAQPGCMVRFDAGGGYQNPIANCLSRDTGGEAAVANARLIAAAPELLLAAKLVLATLTRADLAKDTLHWIEEREELFAAIDKAERER